MLKKVFAFGLLSLFLISVLMGAYSVQAVTPTEPSLSLQGIVQKDIVDLNNVMAYQSGGENKTLGYTVDATKNITIDPYNIKFFGGNFVNESVKGAITTTTGVTASWSYLLDSNDVPYILVTMTNDSAVGSTANTYLVDTIDLQMKNEYYVLFGASLYIGDAELSIALGMIDAGGEDHWLQITFAPSQSGVAIGTFDSVYDSDADVDDISIRVNATEYSVFQMKLSTIMLKANVNYEIVKIDKIAYRMLAGLTDIATKKAYFRYALIPEAKVTLNDVAINGTSIEIPAEPTILSSVKIEKIADVSIPFKYTVPAGKDPDSDTLTIKYEYEFQLPDDTGLTFSNVVCNLTLPDIEGFSVADNVTKFYVDMQDKLSMLSGYKAGDEVTVLTNPSVGTLHQIQLTIKVSASVYDELVTNKVAFVWNDPSTWEVSFWGLIVAILSAIGGFGLGWAKMKKRKAATKAFTK